MLLFFKSKQSRSNLETKFNALDALRNGDFESIVNRPSVILNNLTDTRTGEYFNELSYKIDTVIQVDDKEFILESGDLELVVTLLW